jgi:hypothetical protein
MFSSAALQEPKQNNVQIIPQGSANALNYCERPVAGSSRCTRGDIFAARKSQAAI